MQGNAGKNKASRLKQALGIFAFAVFIWMMGASARAITFNAQNFEIDFPPGWQAVTPTPAGAIYVSRSPDGLKIFVINAAELPASERAMGIAEALGGAKKTAGQDGFSTDADRPFTINGVPFRYFVAHQTATSSMATYAAVAGRELYILVPVDKNGDASTDAELQTILQSFHLITPAEIPRSIDVPRSASYRIGQLTNLLLFVIVGIAVVVWLVRSVFFRPKTLSTGGVPPPLPPQAPPKNDDSNH